MASKPKNKALYAKVKALAKAKLVSPLPIKQILILFLILTTKIR